MVVPAGPAWPMHTTRVRFPAAPHTRAGQAALRARSTEGHRGRAVTCTAATPARRPHAGPRRARAPPQTLHVVWLRSPETFSAPKHL